MRVLVCGHVHQTFLPTLKREVRLALKKLHDRTPISEIIHDGSEGVAYHADQWARRRNVLITACSNITAALNQMPDLVLVFPEGPNYRDLIKKARSMGLPVKRAT
jgi:hypothetical protein